MSDIDRPARHVPVEDRPEVRLFDSLDMSLGLFCKTNPIDKSALSRYLNGKRAHHAGQTRGVVVHRLGATRSVDERIRTSTTLKAELFDLLANHSNLTEAAQHLIDLDANALIHDELNHPSEEPGRGCSGASRVTIFCNR